MQAQELLHSLIGDIEHLARTETIVGDPITVGDTTIIPVVSMRVGFGAGGGEGKGTDEHQAAGEGTGGGGGAGIRVEPSAFIVMRGGDLQIVAAPAKHGAMAELFERVPDLVEKIVEATGNRGQRATKSTSGKGPEPEAGAASA